MPRKLGISCRSRRERKRTSGGAATGFRRGGRTIHEEEKTSCPVWGVTCSCAQGTVPRGRGGESSPKKKMCAFDQLHQSFGKSAPFVTQKTRFGAFAFPFRQRSCAPCGVGVVFRPGCLHGAAAFKQAPDRGARGGAFGRGGSGASAVHRFLWNAPKNLFPRSRDAVHRDARVRRDRTSCRQRPLRGRH